LCHVNNLINVVIDAMTTGPVAYGKPAAATKDDLDPPRTSVPRRPRRQ
jgi:hypothetical protein